MKRLLLYLGLALLLAVAAGGWLWSRYSDFLATPLSVPVGGFPYTLEPGSHGSDIVADLAASGLTRPGWEWKLLMRLEPQVYRAGEYRLEAGLKPRDLLHIFAGGRVVQHRFTLVEGWTFRQVVAALAELPQLDHRLDPAEPVDAEPVSLDEE